jgi:hypothetical protein
MAWRDRVGWINFAFLRDGTVEDHKERDEKKCGKSLGETAT